MMLHVTHADPKLRKQIKPRQLTVLHTKVVWKHRDKGPHCLLEVQIRKSNICHEPTSPQISSTLKRVEMAWAEEARVLNSSTR
jgi:hypothetical protein